MRIIRVLFSFLLLAIAVVALIGFFIGSSSLVIDPIRAAVSPFNFQALGEAVFVVITLLSTPLILIALAIIGLTGGKKVAR